MQRKLSSFQLTLLVIFGVFAVSGILIFALAVGGGNTNTVGPIVIWGPLDGTAVSTVLRAAAENDGSLSQVTYVPKDPTTYDKDLTDALASGTGPDLFILRQDRAYKDAAKIAVIPFASLSRSQFEATFVDSAAPFVVQEGTLGVPLVADPLVLYWNKDLLAGGGFAQPPQYWDQLFTMTQSLTKKNDAGSIVKSTISFGEFQNIGNAKDILAMLIMQAGSPITEYDSTGHLTPALVPKSGTANQAAESALRFYTGFADPSKDSYSWNRSLPDARQAFISGDLAMYIGYASEQSLIAKMNPNLNFAVAAMPQVRNGPRAIDTARVYALAAPKAGRNPSAAITAAYILASQINDKAFAMALGLSPARRDMLSQPSSPGTSDLVNKMTIMSHAWMDPDPDATDDIFRGMIEDTTSGSQLVSQAISRADQQMGHLLGL